MHSFTLRDAFQGVEHLTKCKGVRFMWRVLVDLTISVREEKAGGPLNSSSLYSICRYALWCCELTV
jgi:hypothetical protein